MFVGGCALNDILTYSGSRRNFDLCIGFGESARKFRLIQPIPDLGKSRANVGNFFGKKIAKMYAKESRTNVGIFKVESRKHAASKDISKQGHIRRHKIGVGSESTLFA